MEWFEHVFWVNKIPMGYPRNMKWLFWTSHGYNRNPIWGTIYRMCPFLCWFYCWMNGMNFRFWMTRFEVLMINGLDMGKLLDYIQENWNKVLVAILALTTITVYCQIVNGIGQLFHIFIHKRCNLTWAPFSFRLIPHKTVIISWSTIPYSKIINV